MKHFKAFAVALCFFYIIVSTSCLADDLGHAKLSNTDTDFVKDKIFDENCSFSLINAGEDALKLGLFDLSKKFFEDELKDKRLPHDQKCKALIGLSSSYLGLGEINEAIEILGELLMISNGSIDDSIVSARLNLNISIISCLAGDLSTCRKSLDTINDKSISGHELAWKFAIKSILALADGDDEKMTKYQNTAFSLASSSEELAQIDAFLIQMLLKLPGENGNFLKLLKITEDAYKKYQWQEIGYPFVKAHAILLLHAGETEKAKKLIIDQLEKIDANDTQAIQTFKLYYAMTIGIQTNEGYGIIDELLASDASKELKQLALKLLVSTACNQTQYIACHNLLSNPKFESIKAGILRQISLSRFRLVIMSESLELAREEINYFSKKFPNDPILKEMYKVLAYSEWEIGSCDYLLITNFLSQAKQLTENNLEKAELTMQIGDAFFLHGAFDLAKYSYTEILKDYDSGGVSRERALYQLVRSDIKLDNLDDAKDALLQFKKSHETLGEYFWHAELSYVNAVINSGKRNEAVTYMSEMLDAYRDKIPTIFLIKFYMLHAFSLFSDGEISDAHTVALNMCEIFSTENNSSEVSQIMSQALFIKGACEYAMNRPIDAMSTFQNLRARYPDSEPAPLSVFEESSYLYDSGDFEGAQNLLKSLAETKNKYSAIAYYKMAENYKNRGSKFFEKAIECLSDLIDKYGKESDLAYNAQLEIADIFRLQGRFSDAQIVYEDILKNFPLDNRYNFTELCLAKVIFAQKAKNESYAEQARIILNKLYGTTPLNDRLHTEVASMYCFVLDYMSLKAEMRKISWETLLAAVSSNREIFQDEKCWLKQILHILTNSYEQNESDSTEFITLQEIAKKFP